MATADCRSKTALHDHPCAKSALDAAEQSYERLVADPLLEPFLATANATRLKQRHARLIAQTLEGSTDNSVPATAKVHEPHPNQS